MWKGGFHSYKCSAGTSEEPSIQRQTAWRCYQYLLQNNLNLSVSIFCDPWRSHCFCDSSFFRVIITCTIPFQLRETKPEAHSAPARRDCHVWSQFLPPLCNRSILSLFNSLPRAKGIWMPQTYSVLTILHSGGGAKIAYLELIWVNECRLCLGSLLSVKGKYFSL